ncbi:MAG TPA: hypothetical protein VGF30_09365 [Bacteroidia bacterium]
MKLLYLSFFLSVFAIGVNAQTTAKGKPKTTQEKIDLCKEVENTYQIVTSNPRWKLAITTDVCEIVKRERKKDVTFIYKVDEYYSIKIYSEKDIPKLKLPLKYIITTKEL